MDHHRIVTEAPEAAARQPRSAEPDRHDAQDEAHERQGEVLAKDEPPEKNSGGYVPV